MSESTERPRVLGPESGPEPPYPLRMEGTVISGFGRGSKEVCFCPSSSLSLSRCPPRHTQTPKLTYATPRPQLGIPTANLPVDASITPWISEITSGVYFGYASLALPPTHPDYESATASSSSKWTIYPMVMSIGYNPFYKNTVRSAEVHVLHGFASDFYDVPMRLLLLGFIRLELDYNGLEALIRDINIDCDVARQSLARNAWTPREGVVGGGKGAFDGGWLVRED
jgi:riboflavin kinase